MTGQILDAAPASAEFRSSVNPERPGVAGLFAAVVLSVAVSRRASVGRHGG